MKLSTLTSLAPFFLIQQAAKTRPFGRLIDAKDAARGCACLASDESGVTTDLSGDFDRDALGAGEHPPEP